MSNLKYMTYRNSSTLETVYTKIYRPDGPANGEAMQIQSHKSRANQLKNFDAVNRPLVVMLPWIQSKSSAIKRFVDVYHTKGYNVLVCRISLLQMIVPSLLDKVARDEFIPSILSFNRSTKILHIFCIGSLVFSRILTHMPEQEREQFLSSVKAQIWDSLPHHHTFAFGFSKNAVPVEWSGVQRRVQSVVDRYLKLGPIDSFSVESQNLLTNNTVKAPALLFSSEADPISPVSLSEFYVRKWQDEHGIPCQLKYWQDSGHVEHMRKHPDEYWASVNGLLRQSGIRDERIDSNPLSSFDLQVS